MRREDIPKVMRDKVGQVNISRGHSNKNKENMLYSWDAVPDCAEESCPAFEQCEYEKVGKCTVRMKYIKAFHSIIFRNYETALNEAQLFRIGIHLTPLYNHLVRLKIEELGVARAIDTDDKGRRKANPIFKEIRDTIREIERHWAGIGITKLAVDVPTPNDQMLKQDTDYIMT